MRRNGNTLIILLSKRSQPEKATYIPGHSGKGETIETVTRPVVARSWWGWERWIGREQRWLHPYGRKWRRTKEPLDETERGEWKSWLKTTFRKLISWHLVPTLHGKEMGRQWKQWQTLFWGAPKSLQMVIAAMKLKDADTLEEKLWPT